MKNLFEKVHEKSLDSTAGVASHETMEEALENFLKELRKNPEKVSNIFFSDNLW